MIIFCTFSFMVIRFLLTVRLNSGQTYSILFTKYSHDSIHPYIHVCSSLECPGTSFSNPEDVRSLHCCKPKHKLIYLRACLLGAW